MVPASSPLTNHQPSARSLSRCRAALTFTASQSNAQSLSAISRQVSAALPASICSSANRLMFPQKIQQTSTNTLKPFETTVGSSFGLGGPTQGADPSVVGNAGQSSLVLTYDGMASCPLKS